MTTDSEEVSNSGHIPTSLAPKVIQPYRFYGTPDEDAVEWLCRYEEITDFDCSVAYTTSIDIRLTSITSNDTCECHILTSQRKRI